MPDFRDRERDEADAQAKNTARAARGFARARGAAREGASEGGEEGGTGANGRRKCPRPRRGPRPTPRASSSPPRARRLAGPSETQWGLAPSEWTGDVGGALVTLQSENLTLRRERARWAAERAELEAKLRAGAGMGPFGRVTTPSPPPPSIPESDDNIPGGASAGAGGAEGGAEGDAGATGASSRAAPPEQRSPPPRSAICEPPSKSPRTTTTPPSDRHPPRERSRTSTTTRSATPTRRTVLRSVDAAAATRPRRLTLATQLVVSSLGPVGDALEQLSGAEAMTALMMAERRPRAAPWRTCAGRCVSSERAARRRRRVSALLRADPPRRRRRRHDGGVHAENQKNHMAKAMQAAETRTQSLEMLVPTGKRKKQQTEAAYTAADVAENALTKISEMVPGSTGDLEEQQEMLRRRRFDRHAARLGQISAAASAIAISTVHANAARLQALKEKNAKGTQTEDALDKFLYCKVMTDYFLPAVRCRPRRRRSSSGNGNARRWRRWRRRGGGRWRWRGRERGPRESRYWLRREAKDQESESTDATVPAFADAERVVLKAIRKITRARCRRHPRVPGADARASSSARLRARNRARWTRSSACERRSWRRLRRAS